MTTLDIPTAPATATHEELVARARELVPILRERALATEQARDVSSDTMAAIIASGIHRSMTPRRWGGYELGIRTANATTLELAKGCASTAWCTSFLSAHAWLVCHFEEAAQAEVFANGPDVRIGGIFAPMGVAQPVDGGYQLTGRWPWSSGISHDDWTIVGGFIEGQAPPQLHLFLLGPGEFTWEDTWNNVGLAGSGSHDTVVKDALLPTHRVIPFQWVREGTGPGVESNPAPLYSTPLVPVVSSVGGAVALGAVRGAYEAFREWTRTRTSGVTGLAVADHPSLQIALAETAVEIDAAELLLNRSMERMDHPEALDLPLRVECRRDNVYAVRILVRAIDRLQQLGGARGLFAGNPLQRTWRDVHAVATHVVYNFQAAGEFYGRLELGLEAPPRDPYF